MNLINFFKQFIAAPTKIGAIAPSSEGLADLITEVADLPKASTVIEFGPGTGVFTEKIVRKMPSEALFFALEYNEDFVKASKNRCCDALIYHDTAANAMKYLNQHGLDECDSIICGLPWASFSVELQDEILSASITALKPGGKFLTFAYLSGLILPGGMKFRKKLSLRFSKVTTTKTVWLNIPPAFVYCAEK